MSTESTDRPTGSGPWYAGFVVALGVSVDTSWRFFGERLHITGTERVLLFSVMEVMLLAAAWSMRASVRRNGQPGSARIVAWGLCVFQAYMAYELSGLANGLARVVLGSGLALVALHQALGIEIKIRTGQRVGTLAKVGRELRERMLSMVGLGDDERDALQRTRDRATTRAARLATDPGWVLFRRSRLARAVRKSTAATNPTQRAKMLAQHAAFGHLDALVGLRLASPWVDVDAIPVPSVPRPRPRPSSAPTSGGPARGWDVAKVVQMIRDERTPVDIMDACAVSAKTVQRTARVVKGIKDGLPDEVLATGGNTVRFVRDVRALMATEVES
jgi:hypothetical protein